MIELERLTRTFDGRGGVRDVDLTVDDGEMIAIVGPSGCGKSTLLSLIVGLDAPTSGALRIDGRDATRLDPKQRGVALVFQSYALYPHFDVRRNIAFPLEIDRVGKAEIDARVRATAERLAIAHLLDRKPKQLSGGERQRVALARAIVRRPRVCLFDEPLSNLDPALRAQMRVEIRALHRELGATFVWVTHDQAEAMTLADRVVVLREGRVRQVGPPREIYARPVDTFVASFFGAPAINLMEGDTLGVRPEHVTVARSGDGVQGRVVLVEPLGAETWVTVDGGGARITGRGDPELTTGDAVVARWEASDVLRFDERGARVEGPAVVDAPP
ncbi:MAG: ABC transporter ATP-binding protein [Deltaproteobacteria bacterium]|nr:ABC transporter ATP-binding protein [Deltaproteobacteria bacterium]